MRILLNVRIPHEPSNTLVREGKAEAIIQDIINELKPESIYFTEQGGTRGAVAIVNIDEPSQIPSYSEPFFWSLMPIVSLELQWLQRTLVKQGLTPWVKSGGELPVS